MQVIRNLFRKNKFQEGDILYLQRQNRKTLIYLTDGRIISTYEPLKNVLTELSSDVFENINKGIVVNHAYITRDVDGYVLLSDGSGFTRRKKPLKNRMNSGSPDVREEIRRRVTRLSDQPFLLAVEDDCDGPARASSRTADGSLVESVTYECEEGYWLRIEFTACEQKVFSTGERKKQDL